MKSYLLIIFSLFVNNVFSLKGDATYYDVGLGSCGNKNNDNDMVVALSSKIMGGYNSKYCGKSIIAKYGSKSVKVKIVDTCSGCSKNDIDLSPSAFKKLANLNKGRIKVNWNFN